MTENRRYTEQEFATIISESIQPRLAPAARALQPRPGLSLGEIQAIAAEVGVDAAMVARVARLLPLQAESGTARLVGGPERFQLEFALDRGADGAALDRVAEAIRRVTASQGTVERTERTLAWASRELTSLAVNVTSGENESRVMIMADRGGAAGLSILFTLLGAGFAFGLGGAILEPTGIAGIGGLGLGIGATAAAVARSLWARSTRHWRSLLGRLTHAVSDAIEGTDGS